MVGQCIGAFTSPVTCVSVNFLSNKSGSACAGLIDHALMAQVSFGIHDTEEEAARQYDRALIIEKGRAAKTNFPLGVYDEEVSNFEKFVARRWVLGALQSVSYSCRGNSTASKSG